METFRSPPPANLTLFCSKGTVHHVQFRSTADRVQAEVEHVLQVLGVQEETRSRVYTRLNGYPFAEGFRFEEGKGADRTVVFANHMLGNPEVDGPDAKKIPMPSFAQAFPGAKPEHGVDVGKQWRIPA